MAQYDGDLLLRRVMSSIRTEDQSSNLQGLLEAFFTGYNIEHLKLLLRNPVVARHAAWLASELGTLVAPVVRDVLPLLHDPDKNARFFALDSVLVCQEMLNGEELLLAVRLIDDAESAVRWKVTTRLLPGLSRAMLELASKSGTIDPYYRGLSLLIREPIREEVERDLESTVPSSRRFAMAALLRDRNRLGGLLEKAAASDDPEIAEYANEAKTAAAD